MNQTQVNMFNGNNVNASIGNFGTEFEEQEDLRNRINVM